MRVERSVPTHAPDNHRLTSLLGCLLVDDSGVADLKNVKPGDTLLGGVGFEATAPTEPFIQGKSNAARYCIRYMVPPSKAAKDKAPEPKVQ